MVLLSISIANRFLPFYFIFFTKTFASLVAFLLLWRFCQSFLLYVLPGISYILLSNSFTKGSLSV